MKSIKNLREQHNLIVEKEEHDMNKLTQLVRAGLFDAKKISALKRAMDKPADKMTAQEKRMMISLLDSLMAQVLSDKQVYRKVKQDVMMKEAKDYYATPDPRVQRVGYPSQKEAPSVLLLKRKAIRVFPDGQKVALYYAQAIDKYVSIPYNEIGVNEQVELDENVVGAVIKGIATVGKAAVSKGKAALDAYKAGRAVSSAEKAARVAKRQKAVDRLKSIRSKNKNALRGKGGKKAGALAAATAAIAANSGGGSGGGSEPKYFTPMSSKIQANVSGPKREGGADARLEKERQANARATKAAAQNESVELDGNVFKLNNTTTQKVTALYESLNTKNKKKMVEMMKESEESLEKVISFAVRQ
jgi:hypothetical protein